jgi:phosphoglycerol transferase
MSATPDATNRSVPYFLWAAMLVAFFLLLARTYGLYPSVVDEYVYSKFARLVPFSDATIPGYLFYALFRATNLCTDGWLDCARLINITLFVSAAPFVYLTARSVCGRATSALIAVLALLGPINSFTAYFMPETFYYFVFWVFTWYVLRDGQDITPRVAVTAGGILGLMALIKPHALFLLAALLPYLAYVTRYQLKEGWLVRALVNCIAFVVAVVAVKLLVGYALAGTAGLNLFGTTYSNIAASSSSDSAMYWDVARDAVESLRGHILALALLASVPLAVLVQWLGRDSWSVHTPGATARLNVYTLLVLAVLVTVVALFTASMVKFDSPAVLRRLHMRYYDFTLPLLLMVAGAQAKGGIAGWTIKGRVLAAIPLSLAAAYAITSRLAPFLPNYVDGPEIRGVFAHTDIFCALGIVTCASLVLWVVKPRLGAQSFLFIFSPIAIVISTLVVNNDLRNRTHASAYDRAALFAKSYLGADDIGRLLIVGSDLGPLVLSRAHFNDPRVATEAIPHGATFDLSKVSAGKLWLLLVGDHHLVGDPANVLPLNGYSLVKLEQANWVDFRQVRWPGVLRRVSGLSVAEPWGTWSVGDTVRLEFVDPLPIKCVIHLRARAFDSNVGADFKAVLGDQEKVFTLGRSFGDVELTFDNASRASVLTIKVPNPKSAKDLGLGPGERKLGLAFVDMKVGNASAVRLSDRVPGRKGAQPTPGAAPLMDFRQAAWPGLVKGVSGLSVTEPWGTWSIGDKVRFEFVEPLPVKSVIRLKARAFDSNVGAPFKAILGDQETSFTLGRTFGDVVLAFDNTSRSNVLTFKIPNPRSARELGLGPGERQLGLAFVEMKIEAGGPHAAEGEVPHP